MGQPGRPHVERIFGIAQHPSNEAAASRESRTPGHAYTAKRSLLGLLRVQVPRFPTFVSLTRPAYLGSPPNGSVHIDRPRRPHAPMSCLTTRTPGLREFRRHPN